MTSSVFFDHRRHLLKVNHVNARLHVLACKGKEHLSQPTSHTDHRALYAAVIGAISDQQGQAS